MLYKGQKTGPYVLIQRLGEGRFGEVWVAENRFKQVPSKVIIKLINDRQANYRAIKEELEIWIEPHPHILAPIEVSEHEGQILLVREFVSATLEARLKETRKMATGRAVNIFMGILRGLEHIHSHYIIHRDLRPTNIMLIGDTPRITDFGIAKSFKSYGESFKDNSRDLSRLVYASPESFEGHKSVQTDLWSAGVIFYQMLTGELPFRQENPKMLREVILNHPPIPLPSSFPPDLQTFVSNSLAKSSVERFVSAEQMRERLQLIFPVSLPSEVEEKPVDELSNAEVVSLTKIKMSSEQQEQLTELLEKEEAGILTESQRDQLDSLMDIYDQNLLRKSEALSVAVERGLIAPLSK